MTASLRCLTNPMSVSKVQRWGKGQEETRKTTLSSLTLRRKRSSASASSVIICSAKLPWQEKLSPKQWNRLKKWKACWRNTLPQSSSLVSESLWLGMMYTNKINTEQPLCTSCCSFVIQGPSELLAKLSTIGLKGKMVSKPCWVWISCSARRRQRLARLQERAGQDHADGAAVCLFYQSLVVR